MEGSNLDIRTLRGRIVHIEWFGHGRMSTTRLLLNANCLSEERSSPLRCGFVLWSRWVQMGRKFPVTAVVFHILIENNMDGKAIKRLLSWLAIQLLAVYSLAHRSVSLIKMFRGSNETRFNYKIFIEYNLSKLPKGKAYNPTSGTLMKLYCPTGVPSVNLLSCNGAHERCITSREALAFV